MRTTNWQMFRFSLVYFNSQISIFLIPILITSSGYHGWISIVLGSVGSMILLFVTIQVGKLSANRAWIDFGKEIVGKWIHGALVFLLLSWCVYNASYDMENFVLFFGSNYMRETPQLFIILVIGGVILFTASRGFSTLVYMADGIFLLLIATTLFTFYMFLPNAEFEMLPAFIHYHEPDLIFHDTVIVISWFCEWVVFLFMAPELKINNKMLKKLMISEFVLTFLVLAGWMMTLLNFGPHLGKELHYPYLDIVRSSSHDDLLGNLDPLLIAIWSASMFLHSSFLIYVAYKCSLYLTKQKAKNYIIPFLVFCSVFIAYLYSRSITRYYKDFASYITVILWLGVECIPVYYYIAAFIRSKISKPAS